MQIYRTLKEIEKDTNSVLTVGTFDGVHKGHQLIIKRLLEISEKKNLRPVILTFDPHPQIVLKRHGLAPIQLLTNIDERIELFGKYGIKHTLIIPFSTEFSHMKPDIFVRDYLSGLVGAKIILIGYDHLFGRDREGGVELLRKLSSELSFDIEIIDPLQNKDIIISSTKIRNAIKKQQIESANEMLGYNYFVNGKVVVGDKRGAQLGYPTANIGVKDPNKLLPGNGVYLVSSLINDKQYFGMANLGVRPTFTDTTIPQLEVNYFDFNRDIYNQKIIIEFLRFLRDEQKFETVNDLLDQLKKDKINCEKMILEIRQ